MTPATLQSRLDAIGPRGDDCRCRPERHSTGGHYCCIAWSGTANHPCSDRRSQCWRFRSRHRCRQYRYGRPGQLWASLSRQSFSVEPMLRGRYISRPMRSPLPPIPEVQDVLATPTGRAAAARAARLSQDEGMPFDPNSVRGVDLIKRTLDDIVSEGQRAGRNNEARIIANLRDRACQRDGQPRPGIRHGARCLCWRKRDPGRSTVRPQPFQRSNHAASDRRSACGDDVQRARCLHAGCARPGAKHHGHCPQ